ncbi:MAG: type II secretion system protein N [Candidatus Electrothrix sp.]
MVRVVAILAGIFFAAYVAVHLGYARLEKELLGRSCFGIAERPVSETINPAKDGKPNQSMPRNSAPHKAQASNDNETPDFQMIIRRNIFQLVQEEEPSNTGQQPVAVEKAPEEVPTALNLTLLGTVLGDDHTSRAIIIEEKQNEQKLYQIGDAVQGAIIESIARGKVVLDVFGAKETLMMKKREGGGPSAPQLSDRVFRPQPQPTPDPDPDLEEGEVVREEQVRQSRRRPPSIRPNRRIDFRRNPIRTRPDMEPEEEDVVHEEEGAAPPILEEELPPLD